MAERKVPSWIEENVFTVAPELADTTLFRFNVILSARDEDGKQRKVQVDMLPDLGIDYDILESQLLDIPAQYAYWATIYSEAKFNVAVTERKAKQRYGEVIEQVCQDHRDAGHKPPSADLVKRVVEKDSQYINDEVRHHQAQMIAGKLYHMVEAIRMKSDIARTLAGFKRNEQERS